VVKAVVTACFPFNLDMFSCLVAILSGSCIFLIWVLLRFRRDPGSSFCSMVKAAYCGCLVPTPPPTPNLTRQALLGFHHRERKISMPPPYEPPPTYHQVTLSSQGIYLSLPSEPSLPTHSRLSSSPTPSLTHTPSPTLPSSPIHTQTPTTTPSLPFRSREPSDPPPRYSQIGNISFVV